MSRKLGFLILLLAIVQNANSAWGGPEDTQPPVGDCAPAMADGANGSPEDSLKHLAHPARGPAFHIAVVGLTAIAISPMAFWVSSLKNINFPPAAFAALADPSKDTQTLKVAPLQLEADKNALTFYEEGKGFGKTWQYNLPNNHFGIFYQNQLNEIVAQGISRPIANGISLDIRDGEGTRIGSIEEVWRFDSFDTLSTYRILDLSGNVAAQSNPRSAQAAMSVEFNSLSGTTVLTYQLNQDHSFNGTRISSLTLTPESHIDPRLVILFPAAKSAIDKRQKSANDNPK